MNRSQVVALVDEALAGFEDGILTEKDAARALLLAAAEYGEDGVLGRALIALVDAS